MDVTVRVGIEAHVESAISIDPGDVIARHAEHGREYAGDDGFPIRLRGGGQHGAADENGIVT